jgi:hypothetical protein
MWGDSPKAVRLFIRLSCHLGGKFPDGKSSVFAHFLCAFAGLLAGAKNGAARQFSGISGRMKLTVSWSRQGYAEFLGGCRSSKIGKSRGLTIGINMESLRLTRRLAAVAGGAAIVTMVGLTASCAKEEQKAPETTTTTTTTTTATTTPPETPAPPPPASPSEKSINPTGGNLFTPPVYAPPAPTQPPGVHRNNG